MAKVTVDIGGVAAKIAKLHSSSALGTFAASEAMRGMDKYVPARTGVLAGTAFASPWKVTYPQSYAIYPYNGRGTIRQDMHPNATAHWDEAWFSAEGAAYSKAVEAYISRM